ANHGDRHAMAALVIGEETAAMHIDLAALAVRLLHAEHVDVIHVVTFVVHVDRPMIREQHGRDEGAGHTALADMYRIFVSEIFARALFRAQSVDADADGKLEDNDRIRAEASKHAGNGRVEPGENRTNSDDGPGADNYAEHRRKRAHLMRPDRLQREQRPVLCCNPDHYSSLSATMGSSLDACLAG